MQDNTNKDLEMKSVVEILKGIEELNLVLDDQTHSLRQEYLDPIREHISFGKGYPSLTELNGLRNMALDIIKNVSQIEALIKIGELQ